MFSNFNSVQKTKFNVAGCVLSVTQNKHFDFELNLQLSEHNVPI